MQQPGSEAPVAPQDAYGQALPGNFQRVGRVLNALGTVWIIALMVLINSDVLGRNLFKAPVRGVTELVALSIVGIVFLQLADTLHSGRFTRADVLLDRLKRDGLLDANWVQAGDTRPRKYYQLSAKGLQRLAELSACWLQTAEDIGQLLGRAAQRGKGPQGEL